MWKKIPDSIILGTISGFLSLSIFYIAFSYLRLLIVFYSSNPYILQPPRVQLFTIFTNVVLFRIVILNFDKEKFGKGILLATLLASFVYFFFLLKYHRSII
jgi:hypothetical protein